jgi:glutamine amidotransferase
MSTTKIAIVDYGLGNHASIFSCLKLLGYEVILTQCPNAIDKSDLLILPGVGAFPVVMANLRKLCLIDCIVSQSSKKPIIGICLGMQLLASSSKENGITKGLNLIDGHVVPFQNNSSHIGWNKLSAIKEKNLSQLFLDKHFYFNHSYYFAGDESNTLAQADFSIKFPAIIKKNNILGIQFHPEKSQHAGRLILSNLITNLLND